MLAHTEIPNFFSFAEVYDQAVARAPTPAIFVEIGTWYGASAAYLGMKIRESGKQIKVFAIDNFTAVSNRRVHNPRRRICLWFLTGDGPVGAGFALPCSTLMPGILPGVRFRRGDFFGPEARLRSRRYMCPKGWETVTRGGLPAGL